MTGILIFNQDRPDIVLNNGRLYGGLHCGECFLCYMDGNWADVRLEYDEDWLLLYQGHKTHIPYGSQIQI